MTDLDLTQHVPAPVDRAWEAISTADGVARWWAPGDLRAEVGHEFTLDMGSWGQTRCVVTEVDEPTRLAYVFDPDGMGWTMTWTLTPEGDGTLVRLVQSGFDLDDQQHAFAYEAMGSGWREQILPRLAQVLAEV